MVLALSELTIELSQQTVIELSPEQTSNRSRDEGKEAQGAVTV